MLVLALGIGMASAMASVFDAVLIRRLPVRDQDRLAVLWTRSAGNVEFSVTPEDLTELRLHSTTVTDFGGFAHYGASSFPLADGERALTLNLARVSGNFFDVLGARAAIGRLLKPDDDHADAPQVIVISHDVWRRDFGGDSAVIGRQLADMYSQARITIVGVAPPGLDYPTGVEYWTPLAATGYKSIDVVARLAPGATTSAARAEFFATVNRLHPERRLIGATVHTLADAILGDVRPVLTVVMGAVALLLAIACVNVGNLLLMRGTARTR